MPSETAKMPSETYDSLLLHGASKGLGLQANEVAWYPNKNDPDALALRFAKRLGVSALIMVVVAMAIGIRVGS